MSARMRRGLGAAAQARRWQGGDAVATHRSVRAGVAAELSEQVCSDVLHGLRRHERCMSAGVGCLAAPVAPCQSHQPSLWPGQRAKLLRAH